MKLKLEQLHTFKQVVEFNGFSAAANQLDISKVAVSKQIAQLEQALKTKLFDRNARKLSLTQSGTLLYQHALQLLESANELEEIFARQHKEPEGLLRIMVTPHFSEFFLVPHLNQFMSLYPKIQLELILEERFPHLEAEKIDLFIGSSMPGYDNLVRKKIGTTRYIFCASPGYLQQQGVPLLPKDLSSHRYLNHTMRVPNHIISFTKDQSLMVKPVLQINNTQALLQCAIHGVGLVKLHEYVVREAIQKGQLIEVLDKHGENDVPIYLFYTYQKFIPNKIKIMLSFLDGLF